MILILHFKHTNVSENENHYLVLYTYKTKKVGNNDFTDTFKNIIIYKF